MNNNHLKLIRLILFIGAIVFGVYLFYTLRPLGKSALFPAIGLPVATYFIFNSLAQYSINYFSEYAQDNKTSPRSEDNLLSETSAKSVYGIGCHSIDLLSYESGISDADYKNLKLIRPASDEYCIPEARVALGPHWNAEFRNVLEWGVPVKDDFMPQGYYFKGPVRPIADFTKMWGSALVSQKFKDVVEALEPDVHQFFPVQGYWPRKKPVEGQYYFFHICNTLDTVDGESSGLVPRRVIYSPVYEREVMQGWKNYHGRKLVFDLSKVGNCHIWQDRFLHIGPWGSSAFREACKNAEITGISMGDTNRYGAI